MITLLNWGSMFGRGDEAELDEALTLGGDLIGINNRDLHFETSLDTTYRLLERIPAGVQVTERVLALAIR